MKPFLFTLLLLVSINANSQVTDTDTINDITIHPIVHGTLVLSYKEHKIYVDPYGGAEKFSSIPSPTMVLITDIHGDHLNIKTLSGLQTNQAVFVVPEAVANKLPDSLPRAKTIILNNGNTTKVNGISIEAIPMYNLPEDETSRHPKGRGNGYVLTINNTRIYISGDTEDIPEMRALKDIDVAFICMNLPFTMTEEQAASAILDFKPKIVYPYHYRGRPNMSDTQKFKTLVESKNSNIEVRLRDWYKK